jgi:hypothetical protein
MVTLDVKGVLLCVTGQISKFDRRVKLHFRFPDNHEILVCDEFSVSISTM